MVSTDASGVTRLIRSSLPERLARRASAGIAFGQRGQERLYSHSPVRVAYTVFGDEAVLQIVATKEMILTAPLTPEQRVFLEERLIKLEQTHAHYRNGDAENEAEAASTIAEQLYYEAVSRALVRVHCQDYGLCVDCNEPIPFARLRDEPQTLRCGPCQARHET